MATEWEKKRAVELYQSGMNTSQISRETNITSETVRRLLIKAGVYQPCYKKEQTVNRDDRDKAAIKAEEIQKVRGRLKAGDVLVMCTSKGNPEFGRSAKLHKSNNKSAIRRAMVVSTSNPKFCLVRLDSGVLDTVMWTDIVMAERKHKNYIE